MDIAKKAFETTATIDVDQHIILDEPLPISVPAQVRVIILLPDETEIDEKEWLAASSTNRTFDFLKEPQEDIYTINDGIPFNDKR